MWKEKKIVVVGATGRVGREMLSILEEEKIPVGNISCAASSRSDGVELPYSGSRVIVQDIDKIDFSEYNVALFSAGSEVSKKYAPVASKNKCVVIDNTSYFRMNNGISLIVPEINIGDYKKFENKYIIANPNCSTIQMVMPLKPLHDEFGLREVVASSYQAVSGAGQKGVDELLEQINDSQNIQPKHFKKQIAFNIIPQIGDFTASLYTAEEEKMMLETRKILGLPDLIITATCVRVPVITGHSVSVVAIFNEEIDLEKAYEILSNFSGIHVFDEPKTFSYATPIMAAGKNDVFISRVRKHPNLPNVLSFWCVADNLRKGAALNSVQIAQSIF